ncbi:MAG TPA: hypothetical protein VMU47_04035, partial [Caldimonas sp.]|nr:hypothetical protein [Caldimonas sp.]
VASRVSSPMIATTLTLYVVLYVALVIAYATVLKYMAEKPAEVLVDERREEAHAPAGAITPPLGTAGSRA